MPRIRAAAPKPAPAPNGAAAAATKPRRRAVACSDCGRPEADAALPAAHNRLLDTRTLAPSDRIDRARVTVNLAESPLGWLVRRGLVSAAQFEAGERLRGDFMRAHLAPHVTMRWDATPLARGARGAPAGLDPSLAQLSAKARFQAAVTAAGPGLSDVLWRVVCLGEGLETAERALGWPTRAGKLVLLLGLDRLVGHYGAGETPPTTAAARAR